MYLTNDVCCTHSISVLSSVYNHSTPNWFLTEKKKKTACIGWNMHETAYLILVWQFQCYPGKMCNLIFSSMNEKSEETMALVAPVEYTNGMPSTCVSACEAFSHTFQAFSEIKFNWLIKNSKHFFHWHVKFWSWSTFSANHCAKTVNFTIIPSQF